MHPSQQGVSIVADRAHERIRAIRREIARIRSKDFAFPLPNQILAALDAQAVQVEERIERLRSVGRNSDVRTPASEKLADIRTASARIEWIHGALSLLHGVDSSRLPFEIVRVFEGLTSELLRGRPTRWLLKPSQDYNYSVVSIASLIDGIEPGTLRGAYLVSIPSAEAPTVLMHTILVHEVAHLYFAEHLRDRLLQPLTERIAEVEIAFGTDIENYLDVQGGKERRRKKQGRQKSIDDQIRQTERENLLSSADEAALSWIEEVACDLIAARILGSAFLCAFHSFVLPFFPRSEVRDSHPDDALRLDVLDAFIGHCRERDEHFDAGCRPFDAYLGELGALRPESVDEVELRYRLARATVVGPAANGERSPNGFTARLFDLICELPSPLERPEFAPAIREALDSLEELIPPDPFMHIRKGHISSGDAVAFVFCAAWLFKLERIRVWEDRYGWKSEDWDDKLNHIALKALEVSELKKHYIAGQLGGGG